jgi:diguanylate cyclase (GGDEF)-like protein
MRRLWSRHRDVDSAVRQAAWLFTAAGCIGLATDFIPGEIGNGNLLSVCIDTLDFLVGVLLWTSLARHITRRGSLVFAILAFAVVASSNTVGAIPAPTLGIWFVLVFIWIGSWHPRGTSLLMAVPATAAYLLPFQFGAPRPTDAIGGVFLVIPVGILAAEVIAGNAAAARRSAHEQQIAVDALAKANLTDDLTGLGNRRLGNQLLDGLHPGDAIAILDLDHFKRVNDVYGHARGDTLLQDLGAFLKTSTRTSDSVARMGGEEFLLVLRNSVAGDIGAILERLSAAWREGGPLSTLSIGAARYDGGCTPLDVYRRADQALYAAKQTGRDRVVVFGDEQTAELAAP